MVKLNVIGRLGKKKKRYERHGCKNKFEMWIQSALNSYGTELMYTKAHFYILKNKKMINFHPCSLSFILKLKLIPQESSIPSNYEKKKSFPIIQLLSHKSF